MKPSIAPQRPSDIAQTGARFTVAQMTAAAAIYSALARPKRPPTCWLCVNRGAQHSGSCEFARSARGGA